MISKRTRARYEKRRHFGATGTAIGGDDNSEMTRFNRNAVNAHDKIVEAMAREGRKPGVSTEITTSTPFVTNPTRTRGPQSNANF